MEENTPTDSFSAPQRDKSLDTVSSSTKSSHKKTIRLIIALAILLTILLLAGGLFAYYKSKQTPSQKLVPPSEPSVKPSTNNLQRTTSSVDMTDWQTYRNEEYGFEFKYPKEYIINLNKGEAAGRQYLYINGNGNTLKIVPKLEGFGFENENAQFTTMTILINGQNVQKTKKVENTSQGTLITYFVILNYPDKRNYSIMASYSHIGENLSSDETFDQILSTFRFIEEKKSKMLDDYLNKELIGKNDLYEVYLLNSGQNENSLDKTGELLVYDKTNNKPIEINGTFTIFGGTLVSNDKMNLYLALSNGTGSLRSVIILSLIEKKQKVSNFCSGGNLLFWNNYIIHGNCDTNNNRPWGAGEAQSIESINLLNGEKKVLFKSNNVEQFYPVSITNNTLDYTKVYVITESDWNESNKQIKESKTYDLTDFD